MVTLDFRLRIVSLSGWTGGQSRTSSRSRNKLIL